MAARDLDTTVERLCSALDVPVCFNDPGVAEFGLHNALLCIGDQFIEVVSPIVADTAAGRLLDRRNADVTAYMVMFEIDDLDTRIAELDEARVRTVWSGDHPSLRGRHLHPGDMGGAIVSLDQTDPPGSWLWGGPTWTPHTHNTVATSIAGYAIAADEPAEVSTCWSLFGLLHAVRFVRGTSSEIELTASDRSNAGAIAVTLDQVIIRLV
jgi:hypothetical protein